MRSIHVLKHGSDKEFFVDSVRVVDSVRAVEMKVTVVLECRCILYYFATSTSQLTTAAIKLKATNIVLLQHVH